MSERRLAPLPQDLWDNILGHVAANEQSSLREANPEIIAVTAWTVLRGRSLTVAQLSTGLQGLETLCGQKHQTAGPSAARRVGGSEPLA